MGAMVYHADDAAADAITDASTMSRQNIFTLNFMKPGAPRVSGLMHQDNSATERSPEERMETLIVSALQSRSFRRWSKTGDINARKLIWSNTGYLINWYLTEMKLLLGEALLATLRQRCFLKSSYPTVRITSLWRTVVMRDGLWYAEPYANVTAYLDVQQCGDCTLK